MKHLVVLALSLFFVLPASAEDVEGKFVVALKPNKNPDAMLSERSRLEAELGEKLGRPVQVIVPLNSATILEGFRNGTIDVGYLSSVDMVNSVDAGIAEVMLAVDFNGRQYYESVWVTLRNKPYESIKDLKGKRIAFASRTSTSGNLIPHWDLIKQGLLEEQQDPSAFFGESNVIYGSGYVSAIQQVLNGNAEAAAVSDYVIETDRYLSDKQKSKLKVFDTQGPVPSHMLAVRSSLSKADRKKLETAFLVLNSGEENTNLRDELFNDKLVTVNQKKHLASTSEALQITGRKN